jgi:hypothetical protein
MSEKGKEVTTTKASEIALTSTRGSGVSIVPRNMEELGFLCKRLAVSGICPKAYIGKPDDIFVAAILGGELGLSVFQSLQGIAVINGTPSVWGDVATSVVMGHPDYESHEQELVDDKNEGLTAVVKIKRKGHKLHTATFSYADAQRAGLLSKDAYKGYLKDMLVRRALARAFHAKFPDALKGFYIKEELEANVVDGEFESVDPAKTAEDAITAAAESSQDATVQPSNDPDDTDVPPEPETTQEEPPEPENNDMPPEDSPQTEEMGDLDELLGDGPESDDPDKTEDTAQDIIDEIGTTMDGRIVNETPTTSAPRSGDPVRDPETGQALDETGAPDGKEAYISSKQRNRFYGLLRGTDLTANDIKDKFGINSISKIARGEQYDEICEYIISKKEEAAKDASKPKSKSKSKKNEEWKAVYARVLDFYGPERKKEAHGLIAKAVAPMEIKVISDLSKLDESGLANIISALEAEIYISENKELLNGEDEPF